MKIEYDERADLLYLRLDPRKQDVLDPDGVSDDAVLDPGYDSWQLLSLGPLL